MKVTGDKKTMDANNPNRINEITNENFFIVSPSMNLIYYYDQNITLLSNCIKGK